jgi:CopG family nickel-responsive transcriptional regulator
VALLKGGGAQLALSLQKRRFGVSMDSSVADSLDRLADALGTDRSSLIERAVRLLLENYQHYLTKHECWGLLVLAGDEMPRSRVFQVIEEYRDIVVNSNHIHSSRGCAEVIAVHGESDRVRELHRRLEELRCNVRFIPLH